MSDNSVNLKPLGDRVVLIPLDPADDKLSASGIIIPETIDKEKSDQGTVVAVGPGRTTDDGKVLPMNVKVGDKVIFSKYGPDEVKVAGEEYFVVSESNILAVIN